jgi:small GTP-binding protein
MKKRYSKLKSQDQDPSTPYYKLILIGENEVGKTQILHRLNDEKFEEKYSPTFGIDFRIKSIFEEKGKLKNDIQILDIAGESDEIHLKIEDDFINDAHAFLCLFDLSDQSSLDRAIKIMEKYKNKIDPDASPKKWYLIGNKKDLDIKREGVPNYYKARFDNYFEVSAKNSKNDEFQRIIDIIAYDIHKSEKESRSLNPENDKKEPFEIDFIKSHGDLFDEECIIF